MHLLRCQGTLYRHQAARSHAPTIVSPLREPDQRADGTAGAFLTLIGIPLSYSIADGLALGFISYPIIKLFSGRGRDVGWLTYVLAVVLVAYFVFVRSGMK